MRFTVDTIYGTPTLQSSFQSSGTNAAFTLNVNSKNDYVFWKGSECSQVDQDSGMTDGADCSSTPVLSAGVMTSSTAKAADYSDNFSGVS